MTIFYPDISSAQEGISLKGALAACCKATQGTGYTNPDYSRAKSDAAANSVFFFAYHFLEAGNAAAQAQHCYSVAGKTPLMLDVEITGTSHPGISDVAGFVDEFRKLGGVVNLAYLPHWYWQDLGSPDLAALHSRGLRIVSSAYPSSGYSDNGEGWQPYGGMTPSVWQYTATKQFNGFTCDFNAFRGTHPGDQSPAAVVDTLKQFESIVRTGKMPPIIPTPVRHVVPAGNGYTLEGAAREHKTTVADIVKVSQAHENSRNFEILSAYAELDALLNAAGLPRPAMPEGLVYWTAS